MKVRIRTVEAYFSKLFGFKKNHVYEVILISHDLGKEGNRTGYLLKHKNGNYLTFYPNQIENIDES